MPTAYVATPDSTPTARIAAGPRAYTYARCGHSQARMMGLSWMR